MNSIILNLLSIIQYQYQQICWLLNFIAKYIPLKQWAFDDSHSPKYQKFKTDKLPVILKYQKQDWDFLIQYYQWRYGKPLKPVQRRNGGNGQYLCKVCNASFTSGKSLTAPIKFKCPYCSRTLSPRKNRKHFIIHKCVNKKCSFYLHNLKKVDNEDLKNNSKHKYKLHYIYREFTIDFFTMDLNTLPKNASSLKFTKNNAHIMSLCLTMHVMPQPSLNHS